MLTCRGNKVIRIDLARADPVPKIRARFRAAIRELFGRWEGRIEGLRKRETRAGKEGELRESRKRLERGLKRT